MMHDLSVESFFSIAGFAHPELFAGCRYAWEPLLKLVPYLQKAKLGHIEPLIAQSVYLSHPELISIGKGTCIEAGAYLEGPCIIGEDCIIRHGAYVRGNVITGNRCVIGHDTEIKHSLLLDGAQAPHFNYVGDCILGNNVNLGAGVKCANLRLDGQMISFIFQGQRIVTNLHKLGAIVGDGAQLGCNCVTNPGTLIGKKAFCHPCINVSGYIPAQAVVKPPQKSVIDVHNFAG